MFDDGKGFKRSTWRPATRICAAELRIQQESSVFSLSWIRMTGIHFSLSVEGDGFLLMYKRLDNGAFNWPRSKAEAVTISEDHF